MSSRSVTSSPHFRGKPIDIVIDVRTKVEFWLGHLPGAACIPVDELPAALDSRHGVSTSSRVLVYCGSGARSAAAATALRSAGYASVTDAGGISAALEDFTP